MARRQIIIVGGGFSGASAAVQLVRKIADPLAVTIVEPSPVIGPGLAYSTDDPSFRLNAISGVHSIDVADPGHFTRWCEDQGLMGSDPEARLPNGEAFIRRRDFRRYLAETVQSHALQPNGSTITHVRSRADDLHLMDEGVEVSLDNGNSIVSDAVILAVGNAPLRRPDWTKGGTEGHPGLIPDPLRRGLDTIKPDARVLVVGAGLTALDIIASLLARGHSGPIKAISRRGLRPQPQAPRIFAPQADPPEPPVVPLDLLEGELPDYAAAESLTALRLLRDMRRHAAETKADGLGWQAGFDAVSLPLSRIWPRLPVEEKRRVLRHLRPFYDAHRFRTPPMTDLAVQASEGSGQVSFRKAALDSLDTQPDEQLVANLRMADGQVIPETFDAVINCTGFDTSRAIRHNPILDSLHDQGMISPHPTGLGIVTDAENRVLAPGGASIPQIRAIGPITTGVFGDPLGVFFISAQIHRLIPGLARDLDVKLLS
ncbi:FAD/NAD(P)-binding protein [Aurantiacibacter sp. MUD11]|uniref:FAD/NAD(P)-binding protein n=1 Tax=Aurantiacibacter sp. MUD11 TaxID=3003265 RepID=UPI0022AA208F|nr:FAD/NAD(P)-binding protein [Aurantiacibacter sp. MUD11]WAT17006.1 FAD/NAD(P)-binding protein [Aurantiacibacter sp. MUD11]